MIANILHKAFGIVAVAVAAVGCIEQKTDRYDTDVPLTFAPSLADPVRGDMSDKTHAAAYPTDRTFGVALWQLDGGRTWAAGADAATEFLAPTEIGWRQNEWNPAGGTRLWPSKDYTLTAIGYAPHEALSRCTRTEGVVFADRDLLADQSDLLYTPAQTDCRKTDNGGRLSLPFRHALAQVDFRIYNSGAPGDDIFVAGIRLRDRFCRGTFRSLPEPVWTLDRELSDVEFLDGAAVEAPKVVAAEAVRAGRSWRLPPQSLECAVEVDILYRNASGNMIPFRHKTLPLDVQIRAGRRYTFTLAVALNDVTVIEKTVTQPYPDRQ